MQLIGRVDHELRAVTSDWVCNDDGCRPTCGVGVGARRVHKTLSCTNVLHPDSVWPPGSIDYDAGQ